MSDQPASPETVLAFWHEAGYDKWYGKDDAFEAFHCFGLIIAHVIKS